MLYLRYLQYLLYLQAGADAEVGVAAVVDITENGSHWCSERGGATGGQGGPSSLCLERSSPALARSTGRSIAAHTVTSDYL